MYYVLNKSNDYEIVKDKFKTKKEARDFIKGLKKFDKENGCPFNDEFIIEKEVVNNGKYRNIHKEY